VLHAASLADRLKRTQRHGDDCTGIASIVASAGNVNSTVIVSQKTDRRSDRRGVLRGPGRVACRATSYVSVSTGKCTAGISAPTLCQVATGVSPLRVLTPSSRYTAVQHALHNYSKIYL
jgi:hypothetical protein